MDKIYNDSKKFFKFLENFNEGFVKRLEKITFINNELLKIKDVLSNINFRDDGTVNFINIGASEQKELKILTLANILVKRKTGKNEDNIDYTKAFLEFLREFQNLLVPLARSGRSWLEYSVNDVYPELCAFDSSRFKHEKINKEEFTRKIFFTEELEELMKNFQGQILQKDMIIENLKKELDELKLKNQAIVCQSSNEKENFGGLQKRYEEVIQNLNLILNKNKIEKEDLDNVNKRLNEQLKKSNLENESYVDKIEYLTSNKKRLDQELKEEINKHTLLSNECEKLKKELDELKLKNQAIVCELNNEKEKLEKVNHDKQAEISELKKRFDLELVNSQSIRDGLSKKIAELENANKRLNDELEKMRKEKENIVCASNDQQAEMTNLKNRYEQVIKEMISEKDTLLKKIADLENKLKELNNKYLLLNQTSLKDINTLKNEIIELNKEKKILTESEEKFFEENEDLSEELETALNKNEQLTLSLNSQLKQNEILNSRIQKLEDLIKLDSHKPDDTLENTRSTLYKTQMEGILNMKEKLENDIIEKKNIINGLNSENEILKGKNLTALNEISSSKEKLKSIPVLEDKLNLLGKKVEELSNANKNLESECNRKDALLAQLQQEYNNLRSKYEESNNLLKKNKETMSNFYESKLVALEDTKKEMEDLKKKIKNAEGLNKSIRDSSRKRNKSNFNRSGVENLDKYGNNLLENSLTESMTNSIVLPELNNNLNIKPVSMANPVNNLQIITKPENNIVSYPNTNTNIVCENPSSYNTRSNSEPIIRSKIEYTNLPDKLFLLNNTNTDQINNWLGETLKSRNISMKLLFKATVDGFSSEKFKQKCSGIPNTLTIATTNYGKVIGGFTPIAWEIPVEGTHCYEEDETENSFLFSTTLKEKYPIKPDVRKFAICNTLNYGPLFGGGSDFEIVDDCNCNYNSFSGTDHTYSMPNRKPADFYGNEKYLILDYEIYEVRY